MRRTSILCVIFLFCNIYAGQAGHPYLNSSMYQKCLNVLAEPNVDNRNLPVAIQADVYPMQVERFGEYSEVYKAFLRWALRRDSLELGEGFSKPTRDGIEFAYKHFSHMDTTCATECARGYISIPTGVRLSFILQALGCVSSLACMNILPLSLTKIIIAGASCSSAGTLLETSFRCCFRRKCLEAAFPDPTPPRTMQMNLDVPGYYARQLDVALPVDEDTSEEDFVYNDGAPLLLDGE